MNTDLPYIVEYAKSSRAACKSCKTAIAKESLRVGIMVQSPHFDGKIPMWHHFKCFQKKRIKPKVEEIANFDILKWEDQNMLKDGIENNSAGSASSTKRGRAKKESSDFSVEYSKSSRAACRTCLEKIQKGEIRISKLITDSPEAMRYGPLPGWRHVDCFVKDRLELDFTESADMLPGIDSLSDEDQSMLKEKLERLGVKRKAEDIPSSSAPTKKLAKEDKLLKAQSDLLFSMRDQIMQKLSKKQMIELLNYNNQHISVGEHNLRDNLSDLLVFGAIKECPECKNSRPRFKLDAYRCSGNLTEWTKCQFVTKCPERCEFKIPEEYKEEFVFLREYKYVKRDRIFPKKRDLASTSAAKGPLFGYLIMILGKLSVSKKVAETKIMELGGQVTSKITASVTCCISTEAEVQKKNKNMEKARKMDIHVVAYKFVEDVKAGSSVAIAVKENSICPWGGDPILKFGIKQEAQLKKEKAASKSSFAMKSSTMKISAKGGVAVDPDSGFGSTCHVYQKGENIYNVVLGYVDVSKGKNSYYKMQILESNKKKNYYVFRSWGRVGTTIGNTKISNHSKVSNAIEEFEAIYFEKTENEWHNRKKFVKKANCMYPLDIDYGQELEQLVDLKPGDNSKLPKPVQELICLIFDVELMKKAMVEFEIDLKKMPLGKLSKKQIEKAYSVLNEAQQVLLTGSNATKILDVTNRFYTLIPHDFGLKQPTLLDNEELIKSKIEMLDSLLEIEIAYKLLQSDGQTGAKDPVDEHYEKLNTDIEVLDTKSEEFKTIKTYMINTHAATHMQYDLILNRVFKINRHGESERYQKFQNLHNKKLLWHGSRLTNFVGIISQGLRIAPPEAPSTGYMFGKGVYFADMVSKSANYCYTSKNNPHGLLLLCEVALGDMYERLHSDEFLKLPKDKHCTKGLGMTIPDPNCKGYINGVEVPYGKSVRADKIHSSLLYNEYIVYDVNQVNIKYLLDVNFKWKF